MSRSPEQLWERATEAQRADPAVTVGTGVGRSAGLRVAGKIFAVLADGHLVVRLPKVRVLRSSWRPVWVSRSIPGHGRLVKAWVTVEPSAARLWEPLIGEARVFVGPC